MAFKQQLPKFLPEIRAFARVGATLRESLQCLNLIVEALEPAPCIQGAAGVDIEEGLANIRLGFRCDDNGIAFHLSAIPCSLARAWR